MARIKALALGALLSSSVTALPHNTPQNLVSNSKRQSDRADAVISAFKTSWDGYREFAWGKDELKPVTNGFSNSRNGWGASAVDALSTAIIMGQKDIVNQILEYVPTINWSETDTDVSLFETTIRYLGGLLSGYDFLKDGPLADLANDKDQVDALLAQAINLANNLSYAFETPSGVPWNNLNFATRGNDGGNNGLATVGTLILEWVRLSDLSGNKTYGELAEKGESYLVNASPPENVPFPGLPGMRIDPLTGKFVDAVGGWVGGADSYYEYLIKMYVYDPVRYESLKDQWLIAADSTIKYLVSHPEPRPELTFLAMYEGKQVINTSQHLACFDGGNFILAGTVLGEQKFVDLGLDLANGCHETYIATATGIGPEVFQWNSTSVPDDQKDFFEKNGFWISSGSYVLRPETIESFYHAYRATGDSKYQDWVWEAFNAITAVTRVGSGYSSIRNVNVEDGGGFTDFQESFWFAEVLKYCYLTFAEDAPWQIAKDGKNSWVFNTEAHPVKVFSG